MLKLEKRIDGPVAVIGDVHGQAEKLVTVLEKLRERRDFERRWIVFIGDLIDRGPDPKGVLDIVSDLLMHHGRTTSIIGNHEFAMASALELEPMPDYSDWPEQWMKYYGAESTFASYEAEFGNLEELRDRLPARHREFLVGLPWCVFHPQYLFVHAGLDPNSPFAMQLRILQQRDRSLMRPPWLCDKSFVAPAVPPDCPCTVVSGHVRVPHVEFHPKRILLDTTGGVSGDLSCVLLPEKQVISSGAAPQPVAVKEKTSWWKKLW